MSEEATSRLLVHWGLMRAAAIDPRVPKAALAVLACVLQRINGETGEAWPSLSRIADDAQVSRRSVVSAVNSLVDRGYLVRQSGDRNLANTYLAGSEDIFPREIGFPREDDDTREPGFPGAREISRQKVGKRASLQSIHITNPVEPTQRAHARAGVDRFNELWDAYPKKVGKEAAREAFAKRKPEAALLSTMLDAIKAQACSEQWTKAGGQYIPNLATWIAQGRWTDELTPRRQANGHELPRELDAAAINAASMARLGLKR